MPAKTYLGRSVVCGVVGVALLGSLLTTASAQNLDAAKRVKGKPFKIIKKHRVLDAERRWNGRKIFLSSPRHSDSGSRGECRSGYQENVNGRQFNWFAAHGNWRNGTKLQRGDPGWRVRNLQARGYRVMVSKNRKDDGYIRNRRKSRRWGSSMHLVTHTNASASGCGGRSANYFLVMWRGKKDRRIARKLSRSLGPRTPGATNMWREPDLAELKTNRPRGDAYVELAFHTKPKTNRWIRKRSRKVAAQSYGQVVDRHLGYPTAVRP